MLDHRQMKEALKESHIVKANDYVRAIGANGWSDFHYNTAKGLVDDNSKYVVTSMYNKDGTEHADILIYPNLKELLLMIEERFINRKSEGMYDTERNRVFCYFEETGSLRIGTKQSDYFNILLKPATLYSLVHKHNYIPSDLSHEELQWYLIKLGKALDFDVKVAVNDKGKNFNDNTFSEHALLSMNDLKLPDTISKFAKSKIDHIDVIWFDRNLGKIITAFEIELSRNWNDALYRLASLKHNYGSIEPIIVGCLSEIKNFRPYTIGIWTSIFTDNELQYLTIEDLCDCLNLIDKNTSTSDLRNYFFGFIIKRNLLYH